MMEDVTSCRYVDLASQIDFTGNSLFFRYRVLRTHKHTHTHIAAHTAAHTHTHPHTHKYRTTKEGRPFYQASKARFRASTLLLATSRNSASVSWDHLPSWREVQGVQCGKGSLQEPPFRPIMIGY